MKSYKKKIGKFVMSSHGNNVLKQILIRFNNLIYHKNDHEIRKCFGKKNPQKTFYVIRSFSLEQGLLSQWDNVCLEIIGAKQDNMEPIVDFENYRNMYWDGYEHNGSKNAWEYYFNQPTEYNLSDVYESKNVILNGFRGRYYAAKNRPCITYELVKKYADVKSDIYEQAIQTMNSIRRAGDVLGVFARGTDYLACKPKAHPKQPDIRQIVDKIDEYLKDYPSIDRILLATEDASIYKAMVETYGELIVVTDNNIIQNYTGKLLAEEIETDSMYKFGRDYLVKMVCLSMCDYMIGGNASGSQFARLINNGQYKSSFLFDLGVY